MKELFLLRGLPGSGKSTLAKSLRGDHFEADMFFVQEDGTYKFNGSKLSYAHSWCKDMVLSKMEEDSQRIVVSNTFTQDWELKPYLEMAERFGYMVHSLIVENRHGGKNQHGVPYDSLMKMLERFDFKLLSW